MQMGDPLDSLHCLVSRTLGLLNAWKIKLIVIII
jgi:hypothetical protein